MGKIMYQPSVEQIERSQMFEFKEYINGRHGINLENYQDLHGWSVNQIPDFWEAVWSYFDIIHSESYTQIVDDVSKMPGAKWFNGARLNFAENLLRHRDDKIALIFKGEGQPTRKLTYCELYLAVAKTAQALKNIGVQKGDCIAGFIPNMPESIIAMLATTSIGAIWSSSSPDFGINGVLDRFSQIKPKVLFAANGYFYNGKSHDSLEKLQGILQDLPTVEKVVVIPYSEINPNISSINNSILYSDFTANEAEKIEFKQLPFDQPLYIMYSSGTTGLPKSIVHGAGGTLLQHIKELRLHCDISEQDNVFYFTTCGWMMWNWLVSNLAIGATLTLYDGAPFYPDSNAMWDMADELGITVFGTSAKFIAASEAAGNNPISTNDLSSVRLILSTGSPLMEENFDYIYHNVKKNVHLASVSGGTDIISCFAGGSPTLPVYRGELQCCGLAMDVDSFDYQGKSRRNEKGELVCKKAFPSMPIYFWNDPDGQKYHNAYFDQYDGIWYHGDYIEINDHGGVTIYGRSDATLNPGGVRIGTAEIYRVVEQIPEIADSLVVGVQSEGDELVALFLIMNEDEILNDILVNQIKSSIRKNCTPRHVPSIVKSVEDIPYTISGKKVELAVKKVLHGEEVTNKDALANPEALDCFKDIL
ncbi:MAG TPA: acetoacetate--CoA ligase [Candidatus Marinimicrobia bacterium]|nr:acetoacetate--CoA ligase [Candidatus Neomarinimicrobiota bacterium]